jgi:hypothetical protein
LRTRKIKARFTGRLSFFGDKALGKAKSGTKTRQSVQPVIARKLSPLPRETDAGADLVEVRGRIADLVRNNAIEMVETTIDQVGNGHYQGMKYLFEMIGLYPATITDDSAAQDSLAATLLRRLGLPGTPLPEQSVTKDFVDQARPVASGEDGLE